jgi:DNA-directed RNA polymerase subunit M/transcription elongation factor TFIIS
VIFIGVIHNKNTMTELYRNNGIKALSTILTNQSNISILERNIFEIYKDQVVYNRVILQVVGDILNKKKLNDILKDLKSEMVNWDHSSFHDAKMRIDEQDDFIEHPFQVEEGVLECKCGSRKVFSYSKQTRSADEPMTTYAECVNCGSKWQYSG